MHVLMYLTWLVSCWHVHFFNVLHMITYVSLHPYTCIYMYSYFHSDICRHVHTLKITFVWSYNNAVLPCITCTCKQHYVALHYTLLVRPQYVCMHIYIYICRVHGYRICFLYDSITNIKHNMIYATVRNRIVLWCTMECI